MPRAQVAEPFWVSPHAIQRYRERVAQAADAYIVDRITDGLQGAGPKYPPTRPVAIGDRYGRFVAIVAPPKDGQPWPQVVTVWSWKLCPVMLRKRGGQIEGFRHFRYVRDVS